MRCALCVVVLSRAAHQPMDGRMAAPRSLDPPLISMHSEMHVHVGAVRISEAPRASRRSAFDERPSGASAGCAFDMWALGLGAGGFRQIIDSHFT